MLIEFKFSNFRSFKEEVIFSMEPLTQNGTNLNTIKTGSKKVPQLYRTAGIFGANASGKSNILMLINALKMFVKNSWKNDINTKIPTDQYMLNDSDDATETKIEISYLIDDIIYNYGIKYNSSEYTEEYLYITDTSSKGTGYRNRIYDTTKENFGRISGIKQSWVEDHTPNRLFLSEIINKKCNIHEIETIYNAIVKNTNIISNEFTNQLSINMLQNLNRNKVLSLMQKADLGMNDLTVEELSIEKIQEAISKNTKLDDAKKDLLQKVLQLDNFKLLDVKSYHQTESGKTKEFNFDQSESKGTQTFFALTAPVIDTIQHGKILWIDELDSSLHPYLVQYLVSLFNNPETNTKNAQLIFTSHAHYLMDGDHLSRDQIWFTSKELNNGFYSDLYSLSDFKKLTRKNVSFYESYMEGVYGAVPFLEKTNG